MDVAFSKCGQKRKDILLWVGEAGGRGTVFCFCSDLAFSAKKSAQIIFQIMKSAQILVLRYEKIRKSAQF